MNVRKRDNRVGAAGKKQKRKDFLAKNFLFLISAFFIFLIMGAEWYESREIQKCPVRINEVCSNNFSVISDEEGTYFDYIELYNASEQEIALEGFFLSDSRDNLQAKDLSGLVIGGKSFLLIAAVGEAAGDNIDRAGFCIGSNGDVLYLSNTDKQIVDIIKIPKLRYNQVYARKEDGEGNWQVMSATPMKTNAEGDIIRDLPGRYRLAPEFSAGGGFYKTEFSAFITLNPRMRKSVRWRYPGNLYYTLDGSVPTKDSAIYEETGIPVGKGVTVLRARYIENGGAAGDVASVTYFVGEEEQKNYIVSLMADKKDLYDEESGICAEGSEYLAWVEAGSKDDAPERNFEKRGNKWEREVNVELFTPKGTMNQAAGIRVQGGASRGDVKKRFTISARKIYGEEYYFPISLYGGKKLHSFYFRNGFANAVYPALVSDRAVSTQESIPASVYLNGTLYYDTYLTEKFSKDYFAQTYHVTKDNVIILSDGKLDERQSDRIYFDELLVALNEDLSKEEAYRLVQEKMDIQSYIDFLCIQLYIGNLDIGNSKNIRMWRTREAENTEYGDGRWRWVLYDLDDCDRDEGNAQFYGIDDMAKLNTFTTGSRYSGNAYHEFFILTQLKRNETFCRQFVNSFMDIVNKNFSRKSVEEVLAEYGGASEHRNGFFLKRKQYIVPYLAEEFHLQGTLETLEIRMDAQKGGGYVEVNTTKPDLSTGSWAGEYFTDYPVSLTAVCEEGYRFAGWKGDRIETSQTLEIILPVGGVTLIPVFEKI